MSRKQNDCTNMVTTIPCAPQALV